MRLPLAPVHHDSAAGRHPTRRPHARYRRPRDARAACSAGRAPVPALPTRPDTRAPRDPGRALHAGGPAPGRAIRPVRRARRSRPGRVGRAAQGDRPLRPRTRARVLVVCRPDDHRRAQALFPRSRLGRPRPPRPARALLIDRTTEQLTRSLGRAPIPAELATALEIDVELVLEALQTVTAHHPDRLDAPADAD